MYENRLSELSESFSPSQSLNISTYQLLYEICILLKCYFSNRGVYQSNGIYTAKKSHQNLKKLSSFVGLLKNYFCRLVWNIENY